MWCCAEAHAIVVQFLIQRPGADVNQAKTDRGFQKMRAHASRTHNSCYLSYLAVAFGAPLWSQVGVYIYYPYCSHFG